MNENYELYTRCGNFILNLRYFHSAPNEVMAIMSKMLIYRCYMMYPDKLYYSCVSPLFDKSEDGEESPWYKVSVRNGEVIAERGEVEE